jgi:DNA protecting protein DprA
MTHADPPERGPANNPQHSLFVGSLNGEQVERAEADAFALLRLFHFRRILDYRGIHIVYRHFQPLFRFFTATEAQLRSLFGGYMHLRGVVDASRLVDPTERDRSLGFAERLVSQLQGRTPGRVLVDLHPDFPRRARRAQLPIQWLFCHPRAPIDPGGPCIAIVGSRRSTADQLAAARFVAGSVAGAGGTVITGLATGADAAAHLAAAAKTPGVIAVLAGGVDRVFPPEHKTLVQSLLRDGGTVVTEWPPGFSPNADSFVLRNRIVASLATGVIAVSGKYGSGTAHTIRFAHDLGIPFASVDPDPESGISRLVLELGGKVYDAPTLRFPSAPL